VLVFGVDRVFMTAMPVADINHRRIANHGPEPFEFFCKLLPCKCEDGTEVVFKEAQLFKYLLCNSGYRYFHIRRY
jgi:hypothetical protein